MVTGQVLSVPLHAQYGLSCRLVVPHQELGWLTPACLSSITIGARWKAVARNSDFAKVGGRLIKLQLITTRRGVKQRKKKGSSMSQ